MRDYIKIIIFAFVVALLNLGLGFVGEMNLIWIIVVVMMLAGQEMYAVVFALVAGFFCDLMMHTGTGLTSLVILIAVLPQVLMKTYGIGEAIWQKLIKAVVMMIFAYALKTIIYGLLNGSFEWSPGLLLEWLRLGVIYGVIAFVAYFLVNIWIEQHPASKSVKI